MRAVVQRVRRAEVIVDSGVAASIQAGLHVYLGVDQQDAEADADYLAEKIAGLRVFPDDQGRMNRDVRETGGSVLVVSAFTVSADARKGRRPSFDTAAPGPAALRLYERFCEGLVHRGLTVQRGVFGADMIVRTENQGPVCILLDSRRLF